MNLQELRDNLLSFIEGSDLLTDADDWDNSIDELDGDKGIDIYVNNSDMLDWSEDLYNQWYKFVTEYSIKGDGYELYFSTDSSGYNYWIKTMEETPHLMLVVLTDGITEEQYDKLTDDIIKATNAYENEETRLWQLAQDEQKEKVESLTKLHQGLKEVIAEALEENVETLTNKVDKANDDLKDIIKTLKEDFKASDFEDLNLYDIHFHGVNKDGEINFICYGLQGKEINRTELLKDPDAKVYAYTDTFDKKEVHLMVKPLIELSADDIARIVIDAKEELNKKLSVNEDLLDDLNNIEKFYAPDLKDPENLNNIWTLREWTDNLDSKDGKTLCRYTKIGLISAVNSEIEDVNNEPEIDGSEKEQEELVTDDISNKDLYHYVIDYFITEPQLVSIENYNKNKLYDEPNQPKE